MDRFGLKVYLLSYACFRLVVPGLFNLNWRVAARCCDGVLYDLAVQGGIAKATLNFLVLLLGLFHCSVFLRLVQRYVEGHCTGPIKE